MPANVLILYPLENIGQDIFWKSYVHLIYILCQGGWHKDTPNIIKPSKHMRT